MILIKIFVGQHYFGLLAITLVTMKYPALEH